MRPWIKRTLFGLFGATIVVGGATALTGCGHRDGRHGWNASAEDQARFRGKMIDRVAGKLDLSAARGGPLFAVTTPFWFGAPRFDLAAALTMCLVGLICMVESTGVFFAVARMAGVDLSEAGLRRGQRAGRSPYNSLVTATGSPPATRL